MKYRVEVRTVTETGAYVIASSLEEAIRLVKVSLSLAEEQEGDQYDVDVEWDFPQQMDTVRCDITAAREAVSHDG